MTSSEHYVPLAGGYFTAPTYGRYRAVHGPSGWQMQPAAPDDQDAAILDPATVVFGVYLTASRLKHEEPLPDAHAVLAAPVGPTETDAQSIGEFLVALLRVAMTMKRPFGFAGWRYELYRSLARAGLTAARLDEDGDVVLSSIDMNRADAILDAAIGALWPRSGTGAAGEAGEGA